jgi:CcmD family protein
MSYTGLLPKAMSTRLISAAMMVVASVVLAGDVRVHAWNDATLQAEASYSAAPLQQEDLEGESELPWLFAVYIITWGSFFAYVFYMARRRRELQRDIEVLRRALADKNRPPGTKDEG